MSNTNLGSSTDSVLCKFEEKKQALKTSRLSLMEGIQHIDNFNSSLKEVQAKVRKIINARSPVLKLPNEVTCLIFDIVVTNCPLKERAYEHVKKWLLPEVVVSHVCTQWRDISTNYSSLWTRFFFRAATVKSFLNAINRFDGYIKRSGTRNLELYLDFREKLGSRLVDRQHERNILIEMATKQVERWKIVTLLSDSHLDFEGELMDDFLQASAPNLEYFSYSPGCSEPLDTESGMNMLSNLSPGILQRGTPKLRYLMLNSSSSKIPSFSNITTLRIEANSEEPDFIYTWEAFQEILLIPSLTNLSIVNDVFADPNGDGIPIITMNNLKHLRYGDNEQMTSLLPFLRALLLETLTILNDTGSLYEHLGSNPSQTESYFFPLLHTLILIDCTPPSPSSAWFMVQLTRNIKTILISHVEYEDYLICVKDYGSLDKECWPNLTSFTYNYSAANMVDDIADLVRFRPKGMLKLWIPQNTHWAWVNEYVDDYKDIQANCTVEVLRTRTQARKAHLYPLWPPEGIHCPDYAFDDDDPFKFIW